MTDRHDYLALDWVRGEIQETLNQAQQALEAFVENPDDSTRMRFCQTYLHQVYGTLQMVEFYGAALLAEEMEKLAQALLDGKVSQLADAQETLMRAILQLPPYLDRVQAGRRDLPLVLLPLLNDLRASRGESLLSETSLFKPDLAGGASHGSVPQSVFEDPSFPQLARKIRQMYQIALLGVIRGENLPSNYGFMAKVFTKLKHVSGDAAMAPLWQVSSAMVEGLSLGGIQPGTSVKSVLAQLDRLLRLLAGDGASVLAKAPPAELMKNLLYYIAKSDVDGPVLREVRENYRLSDALPSEELISSERAKMSGPDQAAMASVVMALSEEINKVKDALETFVHNEETDGSKLKPQSQTLKQVADTVAVLGLGQPRKLVEEQLEVIDAIAAGKSAPDRSLLMDVAGALLYVEATLQGMTGDRRSSERQSALTSVPDHVERARDAVIRECRAGLEEAKDGIVEFIASQWQKDHLAEVPAKITAVRGGLAMILLVRPAAILRQCVNYINEKLLPEDASKPDWRSMDTLADAITSVEYYLERITDDPESGDEMLDLARNSVELLGYPIADAEFGRGAGDAEAVASGVSALATEEISLSVLPISEPVAAQPVATEPAAKQSEDISEDIDEYATEEVSFEIADEVSEDSSEEPDLEPAAPVSAPAPAPERAEAGDDDLIDDEIVEIFVEEAGEVLEALNEYFPRWASNQNDEEALIEFRRAFHTLKGSGRMVGATTVGELAWSIENMMNRVIDRTIVATPILIELVRTVHGLIPALVDAFARRLSNPWDVTPLSEAAFTLAGGGTIESVPDVTASSVAAESVAEEPVSEAAEEPQEIDASEEDDGDDSDDVLLDIFKSEAHTNIAMLRDWLANIDPDLAENDLDDVVYRAFHTLKGSARMAGVPAVAAVAEPAEAYARALAGAGGTASRAAVDLIRDITEALNEGLVGSEGSAVSIADADVLIERLHDAMAFADGGSGPDPHLVSVFLSAGMDLILDADSLLAAWSQNPTEISGLEKLRDELGLLAGSADTAGLNEISELARALESCYAALSAQQIRLTGDFLDVATRAHESLLDMMDNLAAAQGIKRDPALLASLAAFLEGGPDDDGPGGMEVEEIDFSAFSEEEITATPAPADDSAWESDLPPLPDVDSSSFVATEEVELASEVDPELLEIFLEEAEEVMESAGAALDAWQGGDASQLAGLQRDLHTLKGGARMAGIRPIGDLAHELESLYEGFAAGQFSASDELFVLLHRCHDSLADMVDAIRASGNCDQAPELVEAIASFLAGGDVAAGDEQANSLDQSAPPIEVVDSAEDEILQQLIDSEDAEAVVQPADIPAAPVVLEEESTPPPQAERDPELVEIFLEEADEILEAAGTSLESWMEATDNLIEVQSLQRDLHTLKGGARMAEIPELGDLGHELENLYEGLAMGSLKASPVMFELLHRCHDRLAEMVEGIKASQALNPANDLIAAIHSYIADPAAFVLPDVSANQAAVQVAPASFASPVDVQPSAVAQPQAPEKAAASASFVLPADVDADILEIFVEESAELCEALETHLTAWEQQPDNSEAGAELNRVLHTLKGGARLAGLKELGDISHDFETALEETDLRQAPTAEFFARMHAWQDKINELVEQIRNAAAGRQSAAQSPAASLPAAPQAEPAATAKAKVEPQQQKLTRRQQAQQQPQEMVRIDAGMLESLVNLAGETSINRGRVEQGVTEFANHVQEMGNTIERLYEQLRRLDVETESQIMSTYQQGLESGDFGEDFDPLEMDQYSELHQITKQLSESASDLLDLKTTLIDRTRDTETLLLQQSRINTELQERLMRTRMVPFTRLVPRLRRIVRQVSGEISKKVEFDVVNPEGELDRTLMERIVAPLEHMLRNGVDHGIEEPAERRAAGKDETGRITLELTREGGEVVMILSDDGKGIDTDAVRRKAVERGLMEEGSRLTDQEVQQFIFNAGFSTAAKVTQISGRGVGMDVVSSEIKQMGGSVTIDSKKGIGTRFMIRLPFTLAMNRALMIRAGEDVYAIPLNQIEGIVRISPYELENYFGEEDTPFVYAGQSYELDYIGNFVLGQKKPSHLMAQQSPLPVLLIRSTEHQVAVLVDGLVGSREVVVKSVGPQLATVAGISGATILGDGSVVIILDVHSLIRAAHMQRQHGLLERRARQDANLPEEIIPEAPVVEEKRVPLVMVTDDSVTVRKVTTRLLERNGFEVMTAKDGVDAIAKLEERRPDLMLLDIEMPRMDGFEVASHVRHDSRLKNIPIIMITSRTGEKHRERAFEIGVDRYMGKPFQEGELLETIQELLARIQEIAGT
ncbi:Hpt domain-containing protein [Alcanivorax sp. 1008]|uniref:Hpt domain-containing protein n=1 Tax=Alcanivorax sp. 1008 TaxID=2816853 RepID=UPI001D2A923F|nr:Hpt domain-containing protein [Alcanivorax sp. 1008]MCC1495915.1 Hpt domain-containing protein [Alcanivorax sp. 1008]